MWGRLSFAMLVAGALTAFFVPAVAQASCGDWLAGGNSMQHSFAPPDVSDLLADGVVSDVSQSPLESLPCPCRGPQCRQAPPQPPLPLPSGTSFSVDKTLVASLANANDGLDPRASAPTSLSVHALAGFLDTPDHPPRIS